MLPLKKSLLCTAIGLSVAQMANAATDVFFNPLTQSAAVAQEPDHVNELNSPWQAPAGVAYMNLTSLKEIEADSNQSVIRVPALGTNASMFDMSAFDPSGRYVFIPHEIQYGAGVTRYDLATDTAVTLFAGDQGGANGDWTNDYGALDPATWTPKNTLLVAEEWSGQGRVFEMTNPMANPGEIVINELNSIPNVSHEGLRFNHSGSALYFVDEDRSGSIYKFVPKTRGDYSQGQSFVLKVRNYEGAADAQPDRYPDHDPASRTGMADWIAMTDTDGNAVTDSDPFNNENRGGRLAADELKGTPYRRPEDVEVGYLNNGHEVLYFTATEELAVYSVEELGGNTAMVRLAADESTLKNLGYMGTTGHVDSPDNLAQDALGNIYIIEDWPNGDSVGGDIWFLRDTNSDGVAESLDHFLSLQVKGAESTGMIFNPADPAQFIISIQHPESTGVDGGMGDALWMFDMANVIAPPCTSYSSEESDTEENERLAFYQRGYKNNRKVNNGVKTCSDSEDNNFIKSLFKAGR
jgi:hypothetical protein